MKLERKNIVSLFLAAVFLVYVLSPMMFHQDGNSHTGIVPLDYKAASSAKALHILFEKLICIKFARDDGNKGRSTEEIIIHKARTIIPKDTMLKFALLHSMPMSEGNQPDFLPEESGQCRPIYYKALSDNFRLLSSDLSPPAA
jgi:hypothetical protein